MSSDITILISTYCRYSFLLRLLKFYSSYEEQIKLVILDSTPYEPTNDKLNKFFIKPNIILKKYPEKISGLEKVADGLDCIKTEFSVLCADDDFLIPHSLNKCVEFLKNNSDYLACDGIVCLHTNGYLARKNGFMMSRAYSKSCTLDDDTGVGRFTTAYIKNAVGSIPFFAVHRSETHRLIYNEAKKYVDYKVERGGYAELFPCATSQIYGKYKFLPIFYSSREPNNAPFYFTENKEIYKETHSVDRTNNLIKGLSVQLSRVDGISLNDAELVVKQFNPLPEISELDYMDESEDKPAQNHNNNLSGLYHYLVSKAKVFKNKYPIINRLYRLLDPRKGCPIDIYPEYYEDFLNVKNSVISAGLTYDQLNEARTRIPTEFAEY